MRPGHLMRIPLPVTVFVVLASFAFAGGASPAHADSGCPTATSPVVSGGNRLLSTAAELQWVRNNSWSWGSNFVVTSDIDMGGCAWSGGIGSGVGSGFSGVFDGDAHMISGLTISSSEDQVGLFTRIGGGTVRDLGFTGNVTASYTGSGVRSSSVGALAGTVASTATVERVFTTGDVTATVTMTESCTMMCTASATVYVGGLVGRWDGGTLTDSYATGDASGSASASAINPASISAYTQAGGLIGFVTGGGLTLANSYSTGVPTAAASAPGGTSSTRAGGVTSETGSSFTRTYWNTTTSTTATGIAVGSYTGSVTGLTSTQMSSASNFSGWNIASGYDANKTWGVCASVNDGFPFLTAFFATNPCPTPPSITGLAPTTGSSTGGTSVVISGSALTGATAVTFDGVSATSYTVDSATQITAVTPAGTPGALVDVVVTTPGGSYTSSGGFLYNRLAQTVTWSPTTSVLTTESPLTPSVSATALGGATISYAVRPGFTTTTCTVDSSTGVLTYTGAGSCTIGAIAASTGTYNAGLLYVTFTVTAPSPNSGGGGSSSGGSPSSQTIVSTSLTNPANPAQQVLQLATIVPSSPTSPPALGQATATVNGMSQSAQVTSQGGRLSTRVEGTQVMVTLDQSVTDRRHGRVGSQATSAMFRTSTPTGFFAQGFQPGTPLSIYAMGTPTLLATAIPDAAGRVDGLITLPASLGSGRHTIVVSGYLPNGDALSVYTGVSTVKTRSPFTREVYFEVGSARLTDAMQGRLASLARSLKGSQPATVTVGVVRASNATAADRALALKRARAVTAYLRSVGMPGTLRVGASIPTTIETWKARRADVTVTFE